jgi:tRNA wybutosine-synthesizing protein 1
MIPRKLKKLLEKQQYRLVGKHSAVQICRWTKNSLRDEGVCYKEKFYGIKSHRCCQMTPSVVWCPNKCIHCWRAIEFTLGDKLTGKVDSPKKIIDECIKAQRKLLLGFKKLPSSKGKRVSKANMEKWKEAQEPMQFAISLAGEPTLYEPIGDLIEELRRQGKTSFLVTNGLYPEKLEELEKKDQLPTQLYVSINVPNKDMYQVFHKSTKPDAWERLMQSLDILKKLKNKTRTVFRMNLIKNLNMDEKYVKDYAKLIKRAQSDFIEIKSYMAVGFARHRLGYDRMPFMSEILNFAKKISKATKYKIEDQDERSRVVLLKRDASVKRFIS